MGNQMYIWCHQDDFETQPICIYDKNTKRHTCYFTIDPREGEPNTKFKGMWVPVEVYIKRRVF